MVRPRRGGPSRGLDEADRRQSFDQRKPGKVLENNGSTAAPRAAAGAAETHAQAGAGPAGAGAVGETRSSRSLTPLSALKPYILRHKGMLAAALVALVVSALTMLSVPMAVRRMIDYGFGSKDGMMIDQYFAMLVLLGFILGVASGARFYLINWLGERVVADVRKDVFQHLATLGTQFFEKTHSGEVMSRLTADTTQLKSAAGTALSQVLRNAIMLTGALVMMFVTSPWLSTLVLVAIPAIVLPLVAYGRVVRRRSREAQDTLAEASAYASENLSAVRTMQAANHEAAVSARFAGAAERAFDAARNRNFARAVLTGVTFFLVTLCLAGILWIGATEVVGGSMSGGRLGQFVLYSFFAAGAVGELSEVWSELNSAAGSAERLTEILAITPAIRSPDKPVSLPSPGKGEMEFDKVSFAYEARPGVLALDSLSFKVKAGEQVALVGPSGSGKTTIFSLLLRFYDPTSGAVKLDGVALPKARVEDIRRRIAVVPQDVAIFADTVAENIRYGNPGASMDEVKRAAVAAQAAEFIEALPAGYETRLGERGVTLSGGQRQRLAIARAILKNAPILLLDEATSALDAENELAVQRALEGVMKNRTSLVIAHRLATVQKADRILVLDKGRIVQQGTHAELVAKGGLYARLAELQFNSREG